MIVDGKQLAEDIYTRTKARVRALGERPRLTIVTCAPNFETRKYLALKEKRASEVGIATHIIELPSDAPTEDFIARIHESLDVSDGIIVQLPLPEGVDRAAVVRTVPPTHDVDALNPGTTELLSPVVGAFKEILTRNGVSPKEKYVTVIGSGALVGLPAYRWFSEVGAYVSVVTRDTADITHYTQHADIVVCGAGSPGLLTPEMVREGVIILDAGTSEDGGVLRGDADPRCAEKASLFTPVPGGIGPMTIAILLQNVVLCAEQKKPVL